MKAIYHIKVSLLTLAAMVACTEMEINNESQDSTNNGLLQELSITGKDFQFEDATRSSVTIGESGASFTWDEDDVIGIFPDKGDQVSFAMDEGAGTQTATFSGGGWALKSSAKYAAYYPHVYENRDMTKIPVSYVGQIQNGNGNTDHIGAYDFMAAGVSTPENGAVAFVMQHLGALVQLTITIPKPSTLSKVILTSSAGFTQTGTIDLTAETPTLTTNTKSNTFEISLNKIATTAANEKVTVYFMTAPVNLTDSELTAAIHFDDAITCNMEITGKNLLAGKAYKLEAEVKPSNDYIDEYGKNRGAGVEIDGTIWAPVNCGYHETDYPYGKLYQWGRKYGQGYSLAYDATEPTIVTKLVSVEIGEAKENQNVFYGVDNMFWFSGDYDLWSSDDYSPCPEGWRVPSVTELKSLMKNHSAWQKVNNQSGYYFSGSQSYNTETTQIFLPAAGYRSSSSISQYGASNRNVKGKYYSYTINSDDEVQELLFSSSNVKLESGTPSFGASVRCVKK